MSAWEPVQHRVGARVKVRLRGECPGCQKRGETGDGEMGTVVRLDDPADWRGDPLYTHHTVWVRFDRVVQETCSGAAFAAVELEPALGAPATEGE